MKNENIQDALNLIDDDMIENVDKLRKNNKGRAKKRMLFKGIAIAACFCITFTAVFFAFNNGKVKAQDLMEGITPNHVENVALESNNKAVSDFSVRLLQASVKDGENTLISPLSVLCALSMTANGADGKTREEMENTLGMTVEELNGYLHSYINSLPQGEKYKLNIANSIWFTEDERFTVNKDFLQLNADYYGASIYKAPFDKSTVKDINNWVDEKTEGMIPEILDEIPPDAVMYLVNALAFEAEWSDIYQRSQVSEGKFTLENGETQNVDFMYNDESRFIETEKSTGFIKYYKGRKYAFAALLPNEGISVSELVSSLDGNELNKALSEAQYATVKTKIPKFETEYSTEMTDVLKSMGMNLAFDGHKADFSLIGNSTAGNIFISRVLHKTYISVGEKGTKAGAVTVIEMNDEASIEIIEPKTVYLDRPFVYMLIDCESNIPFFIGTMMNVNE